MTRQATSLTCPNCNTSIEITEVMSAQLTADIRRELEAETNTVRAKLKAEQEKVATAEKKLQEREESIDAQVRDQLMTEREKLLAKAKQQAQDDLKVELEDGKAQVIELKEKLKQSQADILELRKRERELKEYEAKLKADREGMEDTVREKLQAEFDKTKEDLLKDAQAKANAAMAEKLKARDDETEGLRKKVKEAGEREMALLKTKRELEERQEQLDLEVQRKLDEERQSIRNKALKEAADENELKAKEKDQVIESMRKQIEDLRRKAEQGSQQLQGEVQEIALEDLLKQLFPFDTIEEVPKGITGGDVLHRVMDATGQECGSILWESKRTKVWQKAWLSKLRDDQRTAKAHVAIIVSAALPDDVPHFGQVDDVWVCGWPLVRGTAMALRYGILNAARNERAMQGQQTKMELVYDYLSSPEFYNRVTGIVESFQSMKNDLDSEKRAYQRIWNKREKQLDRAIQNTAGMYGDLQGIIGSTLREIEGVSLPMLEAPAESTDED